MPRAQFLLQRLNFFPTVDNKKLFHNMQKNTDCAQKWQYFSKCPIKLSV